MTSQEIKDCIDNEDWEGLTTEVENIVDKDLKNYVKSLLLSNTDVDAAIAMLEVKSTEALEAKKDYLALAVLYEEEENFDLAGKYYDLAHHQKEDPDEKQLLLDKAKSCWKKDKDKKVKKTIKDLCYTKLDMEIEKEESKNLESIVKK